MKLVHVFDAYCGWSHGFSAPLREVVSRHPELPVEVVSGGLFTGPRRVPVREFGYVQGANAEIAELTGAAFGEGYERLIADGSFVMDSEAAARGVAALRQVAPSGRRSRPPPSSRRSTATVPSLSEAAIYRTVAEAAGLDADSVVAAFESPEAPCAAADDFRRAAALGVTGFPTSPATSSPARRPAPDCATAKAAPTG
ncbi:DsbA family protein [Streptomyces canus]|uniref:DsbA family protein n=1 Tax=Streptomyces canus TaxID=58343 RepID=UPI0036EBBC63